MSGKLICLEGFEGAGKTTRAEALKAALEEKHGRRVHLLREPGGDPFAEKLREILKHSGDDTPITPWAEVFAFNAARANMLALQVAPRLEDGIDVISDRSYISTMTYQGYGNEWAVDDLDSLRQVCQTAIQPAPPAVIVVLSVSYAVSKMRIGARGEQTDRFEARSPEYLEKVIKGYLDEALRGVHPVVNADAPEADVDTGILEYVLPILD